MQLVRRAPIDKPARCLLALALLLAWPAQGAAGAPLERRCIAGLFCLEAQARDGRLELWLESLTAAELSITASLDLLGAEPRHAARKIASRRPGRRLLLALEAAAERPLYAWSVSFHPGTRPAHHDAAAVYRLPYAPGTAHEVIRGEGGALGHGGRDRHAIDWRMPEGTAVHASRAGRVIGLFEGSGDGGGTAEALGRDNFLWIAHADGTVGWYAHFRKDAIVVAVGEAVAVGQLLGYSGATGYATEPHLHFQVSTPVDDWQEAYRTIPLRFRLEDGTTGPLQAGRRYRAR